MKNARIWWSRGGGGVLEGGVFECFSGRGKCCWHHGRSCANNGPSLLNCTKGFCITGVPALQEDSIEWDAKIVVYIYILVHVLLFQSWTCVCKHWLSESIVNWWKSREMKLADWSLTQCLISIVILLINCILLPLNRYYYFMKLLWHS